ncbi:MAG: restriction endonuclease, partial [Burkholderiaceae bacterium]|nr:restriction endonuclease [Burkholderiaceae bacterium]
AVGLGTTAAALLPDGYRALGASAGLPFAVIGAMAAWRQRRLPGAAEIERIRQAVARMAWPAFADLLEQAFRREGHTVIRGDGRAWDFEIELGGQRTRVAARRWKSAQTGLDTLRALQATREADDVAQAHVIGLGPLSDAARAFASDKGIEVWQAPEIARALHGLLPTR